MLISIEKNIAFLAMTKTASSSIEETLLPFCDIAYYGNARTKHISYRRYNRFVVPYLQSLGHNNIQTTCLFREPISWLFSWYKYRSRPEIAGRRNSTSDISFDEFVSIYLSESFIKMGIGRPSKFVSDKAGHPAVDYIYKYENMPAFTKFLEGQFQTQLSFPHLNASPMHTFSLAPSLHKELQNFFIPEYDIYETALG